MVKVNEIYKHFKGDYYIVRGLATHSETNEDYVVYQQLYGDCKLFVRPLSLFTSLVDHQKYPLIKQKYRFEKQSIKSVKE